MALAQLQTATNLYRVDDYLKMERASDVRHEYLDGEIFERSGESLAHGFISVNLVIEIGLQLRGTPCAALTKDTKVRSGALPSPRHVMRGLFSYPDVLVVCGQPQFHDEYQDIIINPTVIIEVLSDSTALFDWKEKFRRYRTHSPSLIDYVLVAQDQPMIDHFHRNERDKWELESLERLDATLHLASINCTLKLADVYDRVEFPPKPADDESVLDEEIEATKTINEN